MVKVNLKGISSEFEPVAKGTYELKFLKGETRKVKDKPSHYVACQFEVVTFLTRGEDDEDDFEGKRVFQNFSLDAKALPYYRGLLEANHIDTDVLDSDAGFDSDKICKEMEGEVAVYTVDVRRNKQTKKMGNAITKCYSMEAWEARETADDDDENDEFENSGDDQ